MRNDKGGRKKSREHMCTGGRKPAMRVRGDDCKVWDKDGTARRVDGKDGKNDFESGTA